MFKPKNIFEPCFNINNYIFNATCSSNKFIINKCVFDKKFTLTTFKTLATEKKT